jgi:cell division protein ZapA
MGQVVVVIAGRTYRMNCEDGQESHIEALAFDVDAKMASLKSSFGEIGEQRLVVMAALTIADELHETREKIAALEKSVAALKDETGSAAQAREDREAGMAAALSDAADRIERLARMLAGKG